MENKKLSRRDFLAMGFGLGMAVTVPACAMIGAARKEDVPTLTPKQRWGLVTAETPEGNDVQTVWFNGTDVAHYCYAAHDGEGWVEIYPIDGEGKVASPELRRMYGEVIIEMKSWKS